MDGEIHGLEMYHMKMGLSPKSRKALNYVELVSNFTPSYFELYKREKWIIASCPVAQ